MNELRWQIAGLGRQRRVAPSSHLSGLYRGVANLPWQLLDNTRVWIAGAFVGISTFGGVAATTMVELPETVNVRNVEERLAVIPEEVSVPNMPFVYDESVGPGDTIESIFRRLGVSDTEVLAFLQENRETLNALRQLRPGYSLTATVNFSGHLLSLRLPISPDGGTITVSRRAINQPFHVSSSSDATLEPVTEMRNGVIRESLFAATEAAGIPNEIAMQFADLFGTEIDFHNDLQEGDTFSVIYESLQNRGIPVRTGHILAAEFVNQGKRYTLFRHTFPDGSAEYYTNAGHSTRSTFLRSPLEFSRVTSGFGRRMHPVLHNWRDHSGVDFGAPTGTPVRAASDGVIGFVGRQGGYGNVVILRHKGDISTIYAHLSAFAPDMRVGNVVEKGETIGKVGATGRVTAPHLHYEIRINDIAQNPMTVMLPSAPPLKGREFALFQENTRPLLDQLGLLNYRVVLREGSGSKKSM
jgi:murein DD-endopeptidase MepM/ murein hydrolase activator NlpD